MISTCVILASIVTSSDAYSVHLVYSHVEQNQSMYWTSLSLCIIQLVLSLANTAYMLLDKRNNAGHRSNGRRNVLALVTILVALILQSLMNSILLGSNNYFAMAGLSVMINNMFYGCWISFGLLSFLFGSAIASFHAKGVVGQGAGRSQSSITTVLWTMHLLFTLCVLSSTISIRSNPLCHGMLETTSACQNVSAAFILSIFNIPICMACLLNVFSFLRVKDAVLVKMHGASASLSLVIQTTTTGLVTTPGGLASNPGNLFFSTWANTLLSLIILLQCIEDYRLAISSPEGLELTGDRSLTKANAYLSSTFQPIQRAQSTRTSETPSTDVSDDRGLEPSIEPSNIHMKRLELPNTDIQHRASPLLALPAPTAGPAATRQSPPTAFPTMPQKLTAPRPPPPPSSHNPLKQDQPPQSNNNPTNTRKVRTKRTALPHSYSIAPQPPAFREPPQAKTRKSKIEPEPDFSLSRRHTFMEAKSERRLSMKDPPLSYSDIEKATYYHSSRDELRVSRESSDSKIQDVRISTHMNSTDPSDNNTEINTPRRTEGLYSKKSVKTPFPPTSHQHRAAIFKNLAHTSSKNKVMPNSKHPNKRNKELLEPSSLSKSSGFSRKSPLPSQQSRKSSDFNRRSAAPSQELRKKSNSSACIRGDHCGANPSDASMSIHIEQPETLTLSLEDLDSDNGLTSSSERNIERKSSSISASAKDIDDYISGKAISTDGLRKSITKRTERQNSDNIDKTALSNKPSAEPSFRRCSPSTNPQLYAFSPKEAHPTTAPLHLRAKSTVLRTRQESQTSNVPSEHSPVTSHDDDSGAETLSPDSSFSSSLKHKDRAHVNDVSNQDEEGNFLDFEYRPRAATQDFHTNFTRSQVLSSFMRPFDDIDMNNNSSMMISDPTLDNSIRTAKKRVSMPRDSDIDKTVREPLQKSFNVMSFGKISVDGHGNLGDVNDIVAAALKAATESRGVSRRS